MPSSPPITSRRFSSYKPIGLEGFDGQLVDFMRARSMRARRHRAAAAKAAAFLLVEFGARSGRRRATPGGNASSPQQLIADAAARCALLPAEARTRLAGARVGLGAPPSSPASRGWEGWDDSAVPPGEAGRLPARAVRTLLDEYRLPHAHLRPLRPGLHPHAHQLRPRSSEQAFASIASSSSGGRPRAQYGGSLSGEHGDGQSRGALLPKMFGAELMQAFREFKALWDPDEPHEPGQADRSAIAIYQPTENLRLGAGLQARAPSTHFAFPDDDGSFASATLRCVGVGACRKTRLRHHVPQLHGDARGGALHARPRAPAVGAAAGRRRCRDGWKDEQVHEALDLCLSCKACKTRVPGQRGHGHLQGRVPGAPL